METGSNANALKIRSTMECIRYTPIRSGTIDRRNRGDLPIFCFAIKTVMSLKPFCYLFTGIRYDDACRSCNWQHTLKGGGRHAQDAQ